MRQRQRKFVGTVILLLFVVLYSVLAGLVGVGLLPDSSKLLQFAFYVVAGLAWTVPAAFLIRWMQRPDGESLE
jgi:hypothetical protein